MFFFIIIFFLLNAICEGMLYGKTTVPLKISYWSGY